MSNWSGLFDHALTLLAAEPVQIRICVYLALALFAVMILDGLRMNFLPRRRLIRHLQLHAPDEEPQDALAHASQDYAAMDSNETDGSFGRMVLADALKTKDRTFRSAGSLRPSVRRVPSDLLATSRDEADTP